MFFNEVVGKKNKHKNRKAIWFEYKHISSLKVKCIEMPNATYTNRWRALKTTEQY
jgi:hypothetical protein